jgi:undecaprenyl diphosphate synthase
MSATNLQPYHIGLILDGNRRWAKEQGLPTLDGHRKGAEVFKEVSLAAFDRGVRFLSAFVFSTENWKRTEEEVSYLMKLLLKAVERYLDEFNKRGIKIIIIGNRDNLSQSVLNAIEKTEDKTSSNTKGTLVLCFNYGGQQEIIDATKKILIDGIQPDNLDQKIFEQYLYSPEIPPLDLLVRTSGEQRTSGFMLWRAAYAELLFVKKYWPDFTLQDLDEVIAIFKKRQRRFGG